VGFCPPSVSKSFITRWFSAPGSTQHHQWLRGDTNPADAHLSSFANSTAGPAVTGVRLEVEALLLIAAVLLPALTLFLFLMLVLVMVLVLRGIGIAAATMALVVTTTAVAFVAASAAMAFAAAMALGFGVFFLHQGGANADGGKRAADQAFESAAACWCSY
jgi:hypothetical protein